MNDLYETKISDARWWAYDIPGNIGWIAYFAVLIRLFQNPPAYMEVPLVMACLIVGILPAVAMAVTVLFHSLRTGKDQYYYNQYYLYQYYYIVLLTTLELSK